MRQRLSSWLPAGFLRDRRYGGKRAGCTAATVVAAPAQKGAVWAAWGLGGGRMGHRPEPEHRGGGFIFVELPGCRLEERRKTAVRVVFPHIVFYHVFFNFGWWFSDLWLIILHISASETFNNVWLKNKKTKISFLLRFNIVNSFI